MYDFLRSFFVTIMIIILLFFLVVIIRTELLSDNPEYEKFDETSLKTGDIIGLAYNNIGGYMARFYTGFKHIHTGIIWRDPITNHPYILEGGIYRKTYKGFFKIDLDTWLSKNKKYSICISRINKELCPYKLYSCFEKFIGCKLGSVGKNVHRFIIPTSYRELKDFNNRTCVEATINTLQRFGVYKKELCCSSYFPQKIFKNEIPCEEGYKYSSYKLIFFDFF